SFFFFFSSRRRHTRFSRDWSSDVCSSDLTSQNGWPVINSSGKLKEFPYITGRVYPSAYRIFRYLCEEFDARVEDIDAAQSWGWEIGRASCRGRGWECGGAACRVQEERDER